MQHWLIGASLAALIGVLISWVNYRLSLYMVKKKPELLSMVSLPRQIVNIGYLMLVYFLSEKTPWDLMPLLIGAAVGLTGAMFICTQKLLKAVESTPQEQMKDGGDDHG